MLAGTSIMFTTTDNPESPLAGNYPSPVSVEARGESTSQVVLQGRDKLNLSSNDRGTESKYLRSENKHLKEKLQQTVDEHSKTIEDLGGKVSERDAVIGNLQKELTEKDSIIKEMVKDKPDQEKKEYKREKKIELLQKRISELESELIKERLDKELVIDQLREEFCIEEKARMELKTLLDQKTEEHAHANTLAKKKERKAKNEARRAEEREKMMRDEAQRTRNDSDLSKALLEV